MVEKANHGAAQRWWRTVADDATVRAAQAGLDRLTGRLDERPRTHDGVRTTVGALAAAEPLRAVPAPYPATIEVERTVRDQALIGFRGNCYSVPPGHAGELVVVRHRLGSGIVEVSRCARSPPGSSWPRSPSPSSSADRTPRPTQAWIETLFGHVKAEWPHLEKIRDPGELAGELDRVRAEYNTVRLHAAVGYVTPDDEHIGRGDAIRRARRDGLARARLERIAARRGSPTTSRGEPR